MTVPDSQKDVAALLGRLAGAAPVETHISLVFVGPDTVWKLKKAVRLSFLDFTRLADRHRFALRELVLNGPAAPGLYRDVVPIVRRPDGTLALGAATPVNAAPMHDDPGGAEPAVAEGRVVDWVLRMARVPAADFLDVMAADHRLGPAQQDALADAVAAYHAGLPPTTGVVPPMQDVITGNRQAARTAGLPAAAVDAWHAAALAALAKLAAWPAQRAADGFVRRAHGDLHLGNLCLWQGRPVPFDALEFDEALATIDLGYDLAFLLMDLDHRLDRAAANRVLNRYVARTGDVGLLRGLPLFLSLRAMVRAHVEARIGHADRAASYLAASAAYLDPPPPVVVAVGGLPGTGKSTLARGLAPGLGAAPGALILRSDELRKRRFGLAPEQRLPQAAYAPAVSQAVFADLTAAAGEAVAAGQAVIADATFMDPAHRALLVAATRDVPFRGLWLQAPLAVLEARVGARHGDASDATLDVLHAAVRDDPGPGDWLALDATDADAALQAARAALQNWK